MQARMDYFKEAPELMNAMLKMEQTCQNAGLDPFLYELVKMRAALAWTEAITLISQTHAPDTDYDELKKYFSAKEIVALTLLINTINSWNRFTIAFRTQHPTD